MKVRGRRRLVKRSQLEESAAVQEDTDRPSKRPHVGQLLLLTLLEPLRLALMLTGCLMLSCGQTVMMMIGPAARENKRPARVLLMTTADRRQQVLAKFQVNYLLAAAHLLLAMLFALLGCDCQCCVNRALQWECTCHVANEQPQMQHLASLGSWRLG